jgi:hypothetical protein
MPVYTSTSVAHANPANVTVTVQESTGGGGMDVYVDVHIIVDPQLVTIPNAGHTPAGFRVSATTVSWLNVKVDQGTSKPFTAVLNPAAGSEVVCSVVTAIVNGQYGAGEVYASYTPTVCFS